MRAVFLSASVPDPRRHPRYFDTADVVAIREAVRAVAAVVIAREVLVFGGHPAITPLIRHVAERVGFRDRIVIYQSDFFRDSFPVDNAYFENMVVVPGVPGNLAQSLLKMREAMLSSAQFHAAFFVGGMEGVEDEYDIFRRFHPQALVLPVGSTGAAARVLLEGQTDAKATQLYQRLMHDLVYAPMFEEILGYRTL